MNSVGLEPFLWKGHIQRLRLYLHHLSWTSDSSLIQVLLPFVKLSTN